MQKSEIQSFINSSKLCFLNLKKKRKKKESPVLQGNMTLVLYLVSNLVTNFGGSEVRKEGVVPKQWCNGDHHLIFVCRHGTTLS